MKIRRCFALIITVIILCSFVLPISAENSTQRASGQFTMNIESGVIERTDAKIPLEKDDEITVRGAYTPKAAKLDVGIVNATTGTFYYQSTTNGTVDVTITVPKRGNYYIAIRNNYDDIIAVTGYVSY